MPMSGNNYVAPTWVNGGPPALDAAELQAMCDTVQENQGGVGALQEGQTTLTEKIDSLTALVGEKAEIQWGSYLGTGTYGESNPTSITFRFIPRFVFVIPENFRSAESAYFLVRWVYGLNSIVWHYPDGVTSYTLDGNTLNWVSDSATSQYNEQNHKYYYIGIG